MFKEIEKKLENKNIKATLTKEASVLIAEAGFDVVYGARPLKRALYELVEDELAIMILEDKIKDGDNITISTQDKKITITKN
jgi:ATP-dependent Clp protease ATP-binding subunit ClpB